MLDRVGKPLAEFGMAMADRLSGDDIAKTVTWGGRSNLSSLRGKPARLHFRMREAKLYAFQSKVE